VNGPNLALRPALAFGLTGLVLAALSSAQGGYFPTSWGWSGAAILLVLAVWLVLDDRTEVSFVELVQVALLVLLVGWTFLSATWSGDAGSSVQEGQRTLVGCVAVAALFVTVRRRDAGTVLAGALVAIALVCLYAAATRLFPRQFGHFGAADAYRLSTPIGYWNGLGLFAGMGVLLALGIVASRAHRYARAAAAAAVPLTLLTLYFSFSRGSWVALGVGAAVTLVITKSIGRLVVSWLVVVPFAGALVWYASGRHALTHRGATLSSAAAQGARLAVVLVVAMSAAAGAAVALDVFGRRVPLERIGRFVGALAAVVAVVAGAIVLGTNTGRAREVLSHAKRTFAETAAPAPTDLNQRLFSLSSNGRQALWSAAWRDFRSHPWAGSGAGTFESQWLRDRRSTFYVRDAHSLYLETLAELGAPGLVLLAGVLGLPLVLGLRRRRPPYWAGAIGAFAAYVVHAAADWDWELSGVTCTALAIGAAVLIASREGQRAPMAVGSWLRLGGGALVAVMLVVALDGWLGNSALASAQSSLGKQNWQRAARQARNAEAFMPWSSQPPTVLAEAYLGAGELGDARVSARTAIDRSRDSWQAWLDLALASSARARAQALARATELYPRSLQIANARKRFAEGR
jgi:hypothetical protein